MKTLFTTLAIVAVAVLGLSGCGDDNPTNGTNVNQFLIFKVSDSFTYDVHDLDANQQRTGTKTVQVWTVKRTGLDTLQKQGVSEFEVVSYEADGTTETGRRNVYMLSTSQGLVWQYDPIRTILRTRFDNDQIKSIIDSIPPFWVQISDVKTSTAIDWANAGPVTKTVTISGLSGTVTLNVLSAHKGRESVTVPASAYATAVTTDHTITLKFATGLGTALDDSMLLHYSVDTNGGVIRQRLDSKSITVNLPTPTEYPVNGFDMELTSVTRAE